MLIEDKAALMQKLGKKQLNIELKQNIKDIPTSLSQYNLELSNDGGMLIYTYDTAADATGITALLQAISASGLALKDIKTIQSSLEDIFVDLIHSRTENRTDTAA